MSIEDETRRRHKLDNFPKDRATLSVIRSLGSLSFDMMVAVQRANGCTVRRDYDQSRFQDTCLSPQQLHRDIGEITPELRNQINTKVAEWREEGKAEID